MALEFSKPPVGYPAHLACWTVDSNNLEYGCRVIYARFPFLLWDQRTVIFQLSGFYRVSLQATSATAGLLPCGLPFRGLCELQPYSDVLASFGRFLSAICLGPLGSNASIWAKFLISRTFKTYFGHNSFYNHAWSYWDICCSEDDMRCFHDPCIRHV